MMALREAETSISLAPAMYKSLRSALSSAFVASRSKRACKLKGMRDQYNP